MTARRTLAASEADLEKLVLDYAHLRQWRIHVERPARTKKGWRTPIKGHAGYPDLTLARNGVVIFAELKSATGKATPEQWTWLGAINGFTPTADRDPAGAWLLTIGARHLHGHIAVLWKPSDWPTIEGLLK